MRLIGSALWMLPLCVLLSGCGGRGYELVPVSGRVTLDGRPLVNVHVTFQPRATSDNKPNPGSGSFGVADADGRFTLRTVHTDEPGAVPGRHLVRMIMAPENSRAVEMPAARPSIVLPAQCRDGSITFEVPPGGTDQANFELRSK